MGVQLFAVERNGFSTVDGDEPDAGGAVFVVVTRRLVGQRAIGKEGDRASIGRPLRGRIVAGVGEWEAMPLFFVQSHRSSLKRLCCQSGAAAAMTTALPSGEIRAARMSVAFMNSSREMGWAVEDFCAAVGRPATIRTASRKAEARAICMESDESLAGLGIYILSTRKSRRRKLSFLRRLAIIAF
jgi:hypothetical protein